MKDTVQITCCARVAESKESVRERARLRKSGRDLCSRLSEEQCSAGVVQALSGIGIRRRGRHFFAEGSHLPQGL